MTSLKAPLPPRHLTTSPITAYQFRWRAPDIIPHHITAHHITTTDTPRKHNQIQPDTTKTPPLDRPAEGWCTHWSPRAHSKGKFFLCLVLVFPLKLRLAWELLVVMYYNGIRCATIQCTTNIISYMYIFSPK